MDGDFYATLRWRLLRGFMLWFYGRRCMRCGSTYRIEVDHIIARARGEFGREYQWMPRNLQILCHEHNQEKMIKFDDWRPLWARVLMPYGIHLRPTAQKFERHSVRMNTQSVRHYVIASGGSRLLGSSRTVPS